MAVVLEFLHLQLVAVLSAPQIRSSEPPESLLSRALPTPTADKMRVINALPQLHHASVAPLLTTMLAWEKVASPCDRVSLLVKGPFAAGIADVVRGEAQGVPSISTSSQPARTPTFAAG